MKRRLPAAGAAVALVALLAGFLGWLAADTPVVAQSNTYVAFEAEDYNAIEGPFVKRQGRKADKRPRPQYNSGSGYVEIPNKANGDRREGTNDLPGHVRYRVNVPADGQYTVWLRCLFLNGCGNSLFFRRQGRPNQTAGNEGTYDAWIWTKVQGPKFSLRRGVNVLELANREDGVICDQIYLTTGERVPTGAVRVTPNAIVKD